MINMVSKINLRTRRRKATRVGRRGLHSSSHMRNNAPRGPSLANEEDVVAKDHRTRKMATTTDF